jgi:hypothetical protein
MNPNDNLQIAKTKETTRNSLRRKIVEANLRIDEIRKKLNPNITPAHLQQLGQQVQQARPQAQQQAQQAQQAQQVRRPIYATQVPLREGSVMEAMEVSDADAARENADVPNEVDPTSQAHYDAELKKYAGGKKPNSGKERKQN